jgi:methyltransferase (TIGR00027 family)
MVLVAVEQNERRDHRLVDDDLARSFLPQRLRIAVDLTRFSVARRLMIDMSERSGPGLWANLACRKRFIDEQLDQVLPGIEAVVVLGAGLDTRGCRLARRSDVPVFEVDLPINIARKATTVHRALGALPGSVRLVPVDFERDDLAAELADNGYDPKSRTFFIWEGVTQYLTENAVLATFDWLAGAAWGSRLAFTYVRRDFIEGTELYGSKTLYRKTREKPQMWFFGIQTDDVASFLDQYGWSLVEQAGPDYFLTHYVRPAGRKLGASELEWTAIAEQR